MDWNVIDLLLVAVVLLGAFAGFRHGFVLATLELLALVASVVAAFVFSPWVTQLLENSWPEMGVWAPPTAFVGVFVLVFIIANGVIGAIARAVPRGAHAHGINRFLGIAPGLANGLINATVVALVLLTVPIADSISRMARDGAIAGRLAAPAEWLEAQLSPIFDPAVKRALQARTVPPDSSERIALKFRVPDPQPRPELEARMLEMVNAERQQQGLKPLQADPELTQLARAHSRDMYARGYFAHKSPEGKDLGDRLRAEKVRYLTAGENLAYAPTLPTAHRGLMNSPGHRANILQPRFGRVGIGVLDGGKHGLMVTQNFRD